MNGDRLLLDSVIVIDHLDGIDPATEYLWSVLEVARISAITRAEVLSGLDPGPAKLAAASPTVG